MKKSFKDQLSEFALSRGFDVKKESNQEATKKRPSRKKLKAKDILQGMIEKANAGRNGEKSKVNKTVDLSAFLKFIINCKEKGKISETDEYFCLCTVENIDDFPPNKIKEFQQVFHNSSLRVKELFELNELSKEDKEAYLRQLDVIKIQQENIKKQKELNHYISLAKEVLSYGIDVDAKIAATPTFDDEDLKLSIEWAQNNQLQKDAKNFSRIDLVIEKYEKEPELGRVMSARAAEKAAKTFYKRCGVEVEDVSITQIRPNQGDDWKCFDLKVNGFPVDIKNSRRALSSRDGYVEHCVPRFKSIRNNIDVNIAGILSQYLWPKTIFEPDNYPKQDTSLMYLGETNYKEIEKLRKEFSSDHFNIDFGRPDQEAKYFLPAWIFNYPSNLYNVRDTVIPELIKLSVPDYILCQKKNFNCMPSCFVAKINLSEYWPDEALKKWEWDLYRKLLNRICDHGLSLPFLHLTFLSHFTEMLSSHSDQHKYYRPEQYRRFAFMNKEEDNKPLGIYDPLYTVRSLIDVLDKLWSADHDLIKMYKYFKLSGFHIFQGKRSSNDSWETLIAYCGGWIKEKGKCGKYPLVLGEARRCNKCKKLICPVCDFCSEECQISKVINISQDDQDMGAMNNNENIDDYKLPF